MSIARYMGQGAKLRELALAKLGCDQVSRMCDKDIDHFIEDGYAIFWGDDEGNPSGHGPSDEIIALIPSDAYRDLIDRGDIVFVER